MAAGKRGKNEVFSPWYQHITNVTVVLRPAMCLIMSWCKYLEWALIGLWVVGFSGLYFYAVICRRKIPLDPDSRDGTAFHGDGS